MFLQTDEGTGMPEVATTISDYYSTHDVGPVATPAIRAIKELLVSGPLTREAFDEVEAKLGHLDPKELKGVLLDFVLEYAVARSDDLVFDDHEMECLQTLKRLFRVHDGDFLELRRSRLHDVIGAQIEIIVRDYKVDRVEDLHLANIQRVFGLGFDELASIAHPDLVDIGRGIDNKVWRNWRKMVAIPPRLAEIRRERERLKRSKPKFGKKRLAEHQAQTATLEREITVLLSEMDAVRANNYQLVEVLGALKGTFALPNVGAHSESRDGTDSIFESQLRDIPDLGRFYVQEDEEEPTRSRRIPSEVRDDVWRRDEGRCVQCGSQELLEFDHIIPFSKGGSNTYRNIQLLCESCNRSKSDQIG